MGQDYKKLLNKKKKKFCDINTMGVNIDKNEYYEIILIVMFLWQNHFCGFRLGVDDVNAR